MAQLPHISRHPSTNPTKICHIDQSYPKAEGKTTRKDIRVPSWDIGGATASCLGITLIDVAYLVRLVDGCREIWGSCAIYVGICSLILANEWELRHLCPKNAAWCWEKTWGETSAEDCKKYVIFRDIDGATPTRSPKSGCKCQHRWRNSLISPDIHQPT